MPRFDFSSNRGNKIFNQATSFGKRGIVGVQKARQVLAQAQKFKDSEQGKALYTLLAAGDQLSNGRTNLAGYTDKVYRGVDVANKFSDDIARAGNDAQRSMQGGLAILPVIGGLTALAGMITEIARAKRSMSGGSSTMDFTSMANDALKIAKHQGIKGLPNTLSKTDIKKVYDITKDLVKDNKAAISQGYQLVNDNRGTIRNLADQVGLGKQVAGAIDIANANRSMLGGKVDLNHMANYAMKIADRNRGLIDKYANQYGVGKQVNMGFDMARHMTGSGNLPRLPAHNGISYMRSVKPFYG